MRDGSLADDFLVSRGYEIEPAEGPKAAEKSISGSAAGRRCRKPDFLDSRFLKERYGYSRWRLYHEAGLKTGGMSRLPNGFGDK
jgi:hypothetical protein